MPNGQMLAIAPPQMPTLTDPSGAVWSFDPAYNNAYGGWPLLKNGTQYAQGLGVVLVLDKNNVMWTMNTFQTWFWDNGTGWVQGNGPAE